MATDGYGKTIREETQVETAPELLFDKFEFGKNFLPSPSTILAFLKLCSLSFV